MLNVFKVNMYTNMLEINNKDRRYQVNIYLLKVNSRNTRKKCEICLIKTPERRQ